MCLCVCVCVCVCALKKKDYVYDLQPMEREGMATYEMFQKKYTRWIQRTRRTNNGPSLTEVEKGKGGKPLEMGGWGGGWER